jgi:hypothetical protein
MRIPPGKREGGRDLGEKIIIIIQKSDASDCIGLVINFQRGNLIKSVEPVSTLFLFFEPGNGEIS